MVIVEATTLDIKPFNPERIDEVMVSKMSAYENMRKRELLNPQSPTSKAMLRGREHWQLNDSPETTKAVISYMAYIDVATRQGSIYKLTADQAGLIDQIRERGINSNGLYVALHLLIATGQVLTDAQKTRSAGGDISGLTAAMELEENYLG